ncbi:MAG TPA: phosphatase PAP2 family protein [Gaiellaceae bacterium]|nr:phosphatase PAP2 family protein [Gaiellaceae bacterium]
MERVEASRLPLRLRRPARRRLVELGALVVYGVVAGWVIDSVGGLPAARDMLVPLVLGLLLALSVTSVARLRRVVVGLAVDWLPFVLALWLYDLIRGWADGAWMPVHYGRQIQLDKLAGLGSVPTVWLQQHLWHGADAIAWYDYATWGVYMSYFFTPTLVLAVLWWRSPPLFRRLAAMVVALAVLGCATYVLFPAAPPWLAAQHGLVPPLDRLIGDVNLHVPVVQFGALWETGTRYGNDVAAVPSLHAAYTLLVALFLVRRLRSPLRHLLWLYPPAMAFALVYSAEHYVCDIVLGWIYCLVVYAVCERAFAAFARSRTAAAGAAEP